MQVLLEIYGLVQGVGFRSFLKRKAEELGIRGYVRNRVDGSVEAVLEGEEENIARLLILALRGPPAARVEKLSVKPMKTKEHYERFEIRS